MTDAKLLVTGPVGSLDAWLAAGREAQWVCEAFPLIEIRDLDVDLVEGIDGLPDCIALTSAHAVTVLERATQALPELRSVHVAVVGARTAERARSAGFHLDQPPALDAQSLAIQLVDVLDPGARVLWPRGPLSDGLARDLRAAHLVVDDPIVYENVAREPLPELEGGAAVLFASPSAVRAWRERVRTAAPWIAIAIGGTTLAELEREDDFSERWALERPEPAALTKLLAQLGSARRGSSASSD